MIRQDHSNPRIEFNDRTARAYAHFLESEDHLERKRVTRDLALHFHDCSIGAAAELVAKMTQLLSPENLRLFLDTLTIMEEEELHEGEPLCPRCYGAGWITDRSAWAESRGHKIDCPRCYGEGSEQAAS